MIIGMLFTKIVHVSRINGEINCIERLIHTRFDFNLEKFQLIKKRSCALGCDRCILILGMHVSTDYFNVLARLCTLDFFEFD